MFASSCPFLWCALVTCSRSYSLPMGGFTELVDIFSKHIYIYRWYRGWIESRSAGPADCVSVASCLNSDLGTWRTACIYLLQPQQSSLRSEQGWLELSGSLEMSLPWRPSSVPLPCDSCDTTLYMVAPTACGYLRVGVRTFVWLLTAFFSRRHTLYMHSRRLNRISLELEGSSKSDKISIVILYTTHFT